MKTSIPQLLIPVLKASLICTALLLSTLRIHAQTSADVTPPTVTCTEFSASFSGCPSVLGPNTPDGNWFPITITGMFNNAVGGIYTSILNLNDCVSDDMSSIADGDLQITLIRSFEENRTGCSVDILNEFRVRDAAENESEGTFIFRGTITFDGDGPMIYCPADANLEYGVSTNPINTGFATASSGCGTPEMTFTDGVPTGDSNPRGEGTTFIRTWTATDGCGKTATCGQTIFMAPSNIPTMSQWALFILGLMLTSLALVTIRKKAFVKS